MVHLRDENPFLFAGYRVLEVLASQGAFPHSSITEGKAENVASTLRHLVKVGVLPNEKTNYNEGV